MRRYYIALLAAVVVLGGLLGAAPASAAQRSRCFAETGHCVSGAILDYWERNGGLAVFGYPIDELRIETNEGWTGPTQWFQRDRLEDHGSIGVLAGRLGAQLLEMQGRPWESFPKVDTAGPGCRYFQQTGHSLCGIFLSYWLNNGGLERFGYPISERFEQTIDAYVESFHGRASLARERMTSDAALAFDAEARRLVSAYTQHTVELQLVAEITWGIPLRPESEVGTQSSVLSPEGT